MGAILQRKWKVFPRAIIEMFRWIYLPSLAIFLNSISCHNLNRNVQFLHCHSICIYIWLILVCSLKSGQKAVCGKSVLDAVTLIKCVVKIWIWRYFVKLIQYLWALFGGSSLKSSFVGLQHWYLSQKWPNDKIVQKGSFFQI